MHKKLLVYTLCFINCLTAQERKYTVSNAHAHNDYNHTKPFTTAYEAGFGSIEADIFYIGDQLYVAHDEADIKPGRTLASLYLAPLTKAISYNNGYVFNDHHKQLLLLIDIKTEAEPALEKVITDLKDYNEITGCSTLKIVITGNQPAITKFTSYPGYIYFDGNFQKEYSLKTLEKVALFSDNFKGYSTWKGTGPLIISDKARIENAVKTAHTLHKPLRFWAAPDIPEAWLQLMRLDVDYINTDKIQELAMFLDSLHK